MTVGTVVPGVVLAKSRENQLMRQYSFLVLLLVLCMGIHDCIDACGQKFQTQNAGNRHRQQCKIRKIHMANTILLRQELHAKEQERNTAKRMKVGLATEQSPLVCDRYQ